MIDCFPSVREDRWVFVILYYDFIWKIAHRQFMY